MVIISDLCIVSFRCFIHHVNIEKSKLLIVRWRPGRCMKIRTFTVIYRGTVMVVYLSGG